MIKTSDKVNKLVQELIDIDCKLYTDYFNDFINNEAYLVIDYFGTDYNVVRDAFDLFEEAKSEHQHVFEITDEGDIFAYFIGREADIVRKLKLIVGEAKSKLEKDNKDKENEAQNSLKKQLKLAEDHVKSLKAKIK